MSAVCCWCKRDLVQSDLKGFAAWLCPNVPCYTRQIQHAALVNAKGGARYVNVPLPKQVEFRDRPEKYVLFGGAAGPGKSHEARWAAYELCLTIPNFQVLLLRETFGELERTHMQRMDAEQVLVGAKFTPSLHRMKWTNGSQIECGHMEDAAAVRKYLSAEYDLIICDEGSLYDPDALLSLSTRARTSKPQVMARGGSKFWVVTNPGGPASQMLLDFFIDHTPDYDERPALKGKYKPEAWTFVPALLNDNPYIDPDYETSLAVEKPWRYQQLRYGNFRVFAGQFFPSWQESKHVVAMDVPSGLQWFRSMDWGYNSPGCVLWWAVLGDGHLFVRSELKFQQMDVAEVKKAIQARDKQLGIKKAISLYGDPAMQAKTGQRTLHGASISEALGLGYVPADNDRFNGWMRCHQILRDDAAGVPWVQVHPDCRYLLRSIPAAKSDKNDLDDVDTEMDDHALDAWRYGAMSRFGLAHAKKIARYPAGSPGAIMQQLQKQGGRVWGSAA